ncbi:hypothetical protein PPACK8108_LOCUS3409 [Phakopsora pachyrhizi]|uniref:Uncharacterized protein n=1 Tax=Phakopsora pachyrhizi TaxID=170000 RepID=A0AAV0AMH1_PHAPC|nr:hypothetical protein PPACK8108_LOCUS3409 [Phakopsora pachyrhizi]
MSPNFQVDPYSGQYHLNLPFDISTAPQVPSSPSKGSNEDVCPVQLTEGKKQNKQSIPEVEGLPGNKNERYSQLVALYRISAKKIEKTIQKLSCSEGSRGPQLCSQLSTQLGLKQLQQQMEVHPLIITNGNLSEISWGSVCSSNDQFLPADHNHQKNLPENCSTSNVPSWRIQTLIRLHCNTLFGKCLDNGRLQLPATSWENPGWHCEVDLDIETERAAEVILDNASYPASEYNSDEVMHGMSDSEFESDRDPSFPYSNGPGHCQASSQTLANIWQTMRKAGVFKFKPGCQGKGSETPILYDQVVENCCSDDETDDDSMDEESNSTQPTKCCTVLRLPWRSTLLEKLMVHIGILQDPRNSTAPQRTKAARLLGFFNLYHICSKQAVGISNEFGISEPEVDSDMDKHCSPDLPSQESKAETTTLNPRCTTNLGQENNTYYHNCG